tara:strand:+ start:349 stop:723 length:375 start_codon:yes stop_codon:yes gene_type:complete
MKDVDWKKKCQELENEMVLIKGITVTNSPELRSANARIKEIEEGLANAVARVEELEKIEEMHRSLNGELRKEVYDWKTKANKNVNLQNQIDGQKVIIEQLTRDNQRLAQEVNDKIARMRKEGLL